MRGCLVHRSSYQGATQDVDPVEFLGKLGVPRGEILQDAIDFWRSRAGRPREGRGGHILTGPVNIRGAEPGDVIEVQIIRFELRTPFGLNSSTTATGVLGSAFASR